MLDSLGSTLSRCTISTFFTRYGKEPKTDEISVDQAIICLEEELGRPEESKISDVDEVVEVSSAEPVVMVVGDHGEEITLNLDQSFGAVHYSGPPYVVMNGAVHETQPMQMSLEHAAAGSGPGGPAEPTNGHEITNDNDSNAEDDIVNSNTPPPQAVQVTSDSNSTRSERVVNVHNCPFCRRPGSTPRQRSTW
jgi:phosphatidylserine decarboxylase